MENKNNPLKVVLQDNNFQIRFNFDASESFIYESILNIPMWWTEMFEGSSHNQGDVFTVHFCPSVFKTMIVIDLIPYRKIYWKVVDSLIDIPQLTNKREWINTEIIWEIMPNENNTILTLTHIGLTPQIECYTICENGWLDFTNSLFDFIQTGVGKPFKMKQ